MQAPDPIETILARLMPPALSDDCQADLEEIVGISSSQLPPIVTPISSGKWLFRSLIGGGIAAGIGAICAIFPFVRPHPARELVTAPPSAAGFVVMSQSDRIESVTDDGWQQDSEGIAMHSVRLKAVQENKVRDAQTGLVVDICEPREVILMMPANPTQDGSGLKQPSTNGLVEAASIPTECNGPIRVVNIAEKSASFTFPTTGKAEVSRDGEIYLLKITGIQGELIFQGNLQKNDALERLPEIWREKVQVLFRTLDQAMDGGIKPSRQPQPRITPPSLGKP